MATDKSEQIINDLLDFSVEVINYCKEIPAPNSVKDQLIRSATSIGANFAEAQEATSKKDFANKIFIAKKEAYETKYWLKLCAKLGADSGKSETLKDTCQKHLMILQKIINSLRKGNS